MKTRLTFILTLGIAFMACNSKPSETTITSEDGKTKVSVDATKVESTAEDMQKKMEELKKLPPLTMDQLKAMLPQELQGMKRSEFSANSMMGFAVGTATYKKDDTTNIKLTIYDCAGEAGSAFYSMTYFTRMNMESESDGQYTKTIDFQGQKAIETFQQSDNQYTLTYVAEDRTLVSVQGENTGLDAVKDAAKSLNLKVN